MPLPVAPELNAVELAVLPLAAPELNAVELAVLPLAAPDVPETVWVCAPVDSIKSAFVQEILEVLPHEAGAYVWSPPVPYRPFILCVCAPLLAAE